MDHHSLCEAYLNDVFKTLAYSCEDPSETSGEILPPSITKLLQVLALTPNDIVVDLGSGTGKLAAQIFLESAASEVWGIELRKELHDIALIANQRMQRELSEFYKNNRQLHFFCGNFLEQNINRITVAIINSVCISQQTVLELEEKLNGIPSLRYVLTTRPMVTLNMPFLKAIRIECSWDTALCYVYEKQK